MAIRGRSGSAQAGGLGQRKSSWTVWIGLGAHGSKRAEEDFAEGAEQQLLGEGHNSTRDDMKWQSKLAQAWVDGAWGALDVYSDGGADGAGTPTASAEYGWLVGGTDEDSLEVWAEGAARVGGLPEEMDSTRAELLGAYAVLHKVRQWEGTVRIWVDNDNVVRGLEKRLGIERVDAIWTVAENWAADSEELEPNWRVQLGVGSDGDMWKAMDLLLERMEGEVEVHWVRGHEDKRTTRMMMSKHQREMSRQMSTAQQSRGGRGARPGCYYPGGSPGGCAMMGWRWWWCSGKS